LESEVGSPEVKKIPKKANLDEACSSVSLIPFLL